MVETVRTSCIREPQKYKFSRSEVLAEEENVKREGNDTFDYFDSNEALKGRHEKKFACYTLCVAHKDVSEEIKAISHAIEEGVNTIKEAAAGLQVKAAYKRYTFDFFKEDGGYSEKIPLVVTKQGAQKKKQTKLILNTYLIVLGNQVKLDYTIDEETRSYNYSIILQSGDALVINSSVQGFSFAVSEVKAGTCPKDLVIREGSLILTVEKD